MVNGSTLRLTEAGDPTADGPLSLRDSFFAAPQQLRNGADLASILRGLAAQPHQRLDLKVVGPLRNFLFGPPGQGGLDLVSLNIQRGRDHGMPSYVQVRAAMGLPGINDFSQITSDVNVANALRDTYGSVDQIDLWVGGLAEDPLLGQGSQVGPLFRTLLTSQFRALRDGDRFWYESDLTPAELALVQGSTLASVIRANTDIVRGIPDDVFHVKSPGCEPYVQFNHSESVVRRRVGAEQQGVLQFGNRGTGMCTDITIRCGWPIGSVEDTSCVLGPFDMVLESRGSNRDFMDFVSLGGLDLPPGQNHNATVGFRTVEDTAVDCRIQEDQVNMGGTRLDVIMR